MQDHRPDLVFSGHLHPPDVRMTFPMCACFFLLFLLRRTHAFAAPVVRLEWVDRSLGLHAPPPHTLLCWGQLVETAVH
jgi:hypothetical protein